MEQNPNSKQSAQLLPSASHDDNTMLSADASSFEGEQVSNENGKELSTEANCIIRPSDLLTLIQNSVPQSERMNFTVPFEQYQKVVTALEVCENYIKTLQ